MPFAQFTHSFLAQFAIRLTRRRRRRRRSHCNCNSPFLCVCVCVFGSQAFAAAGFRFGLKLFRFLWALLLL